MKYLFSFIIIILTLFFFTSCNQDNTIQQDFSITNAAKIIESYNEGKLPSEMASLIKGSVEIVTTKYETVLFITENGKQDLIYILQQDPSLPRQEIRESISSAQIMFFHESLLINDLNSNSRFYFSFGKELPSTISKLEVGNISIGYGLARLSNIVLSYESIEDFHNIESISTLFKYPAQNQAGLRNDVNGPIVYTDNYCKCCIVGTTTPQCLAVVGEDCDAGGYGSSQCDIGATASGTSCSVKCDTGIACCNNPANDGSGN